MKRLFFLCVSLFSFFCSATSPTIASNTYDMANPDNWNIRFKGDAVADKLGRFDSISVGDIDGDGIQDFIVGAERADNNGRTDSGSLYYINGRLFSSLTGKGKTIDLANPTNYTIRYDGSTANGRFGYATAFIADINNNGKLDIAVSGFNENPNGKTASGSFYVIYDSLIDNYINTGNNVDMAISSNYSLRFDGATAGDQLGSYSSFGDINNNGRIDLIIDSTKTDFYGRYNNGSVYIIYDYMIDNYSDIGNAIDLSNPAKYNLRYDGAASSEIIGDVDINTGDVDNDGKLDLMIGSVQAAKGSPARANSGAVYVIYNSRLDDYTNTGNNIDLLIPANYNLMFYGATNEKVAGPSTITGDLDGDGKNDLVLGANGGAKYNTKVWSGSLYVVSGVILNTYSETGNQIDLSDLNNFSIRFDGATSSALSYHYNASVDFDNDGSLDIVSNAYADSNNSRERSGSLYIFYNSLISDLTNVGNIFDPFPYSIRYDGADVSINFPGGDNMRVVDINSDGKRDIIAGAAYGYTADASLQDHGYVYIIYNFPHAISATSVTTPTNNNSFSVTGSASAPNSVTNISGVEYQVDSNSISGAWTACSARDGGFDSSSENYSCSISSLADGAHTLYFRAYDANTSYTPQSNYPSVSVTVDATDPEGFTWQTLSRRLKSGNDMIHTVADGGFTSDHKVALSWEKEGDATSGIESYKVYYREKGDKKWILIDEVPADTDFVWVDEDPGEYEWYVKAIDYAGNETDSKIFTFTIVATPEGAPIVNLVNGVAPVSGNVYLPNSDILTVEGTADNESGVVVAIYDMLGQTKYQEILCSSDSAGSFSCTDPALMNSSYLLKIFSRNEVGDEGPVTEIMINGSFASTVVTMVPAVVTTVPISSAPSVSSVQGTTTTELAPGIVRGAVDIDTSINPTAINHPGIVSGAVDFPEPELAPEPLRQNIFQRMWNNIFH